jgi:cell division protein FtsL
MCSSFKAYQSAHVLNQIFGHDTMNYEKKGIFIVHSAYRMLANTKQTREAWLEGTTAAFDHQGLKKDWTSLWQEYYFRREDLHIEICELW